MVVRCIKTGQHSFATQINHVRVRIDEATNIFVCTNGDDVFATNGNSLCRFVAVHGDNGGVEVNRVGRHPGRVPSTSGRRQNGEADK